MMVLDKVLDLAELPGDQIAGSALGVARLSLADWMACGLGGRDEPLARILRGYLEAEGGRGVSSVAGGGLLPARAAALANGAISHALDYDDTHFAHIGHPSVAIFPAALAVAEDTGATARAVLEAALIGAEVSVRLGVGLGRGHYLRGFHQTATAGAFGATVAAGRLYGLTRDQMRAALGLCSTRASGLKNQFGTMGKPYNAGIAASTGVEVAGLARAGFTAPDDGLQGPQGFVATHADTPDMAAGWQAGGWLFEDVKFKLHACCHGTHAMIEGLRATVPPGAQVQAVHLRTNPRWLAVCDIKVPRTGLEVKFSYGWLAAMVLAGRSTASDRAFDDACARDAGLAALAARVTVAGDATLSDMQAVGETVLADGRVLPFAHDLAASVASDVLQKALQAKAEALLGQAATQQIWHAMAHLDTLCAADLGQILRG